VNIRQQYTSAHYPGERNFDPYKLSILVLVVTANTLAWLLIAKTLCHAFGVVANPLILGVGLCMALLFSLVMAAVMAIDAR
jgi:hypothetical protein